ncbi:protein unc-93 homolog A isoform X2 [Chanos chanos]|uniref:Protein unc-93 homolog A n=1 Tax=Chanos chanos TaxID=29144 RepID=A0A6J2V8G0_CHACN|nr:protein unc-93 homolog A isoform X2 [Chanos chanos]
MKMISRNTRNVLVVSVGFLLLFTAYGGLQSLQSSLNAEDGMGVISLSVVYGALILSSMFLPPILIKNLGCKWTIVASMGCYVTYSFGNLAPGWASLLITSAILGLGGSPLWSAKCTYLTISGNQQAEKEKKKGQDIINQYFGIFFFILQSSAVWGNLMSSLIFGQDRTLGVGLLAIILVAVFLEDIDKAQAREFRRNKGNLLFWGTFLETFKLLRDKRLIMLIPLTMYSGFEQSFLAGEYTKNYVTCALGIQYVGFVMICFGATNSVCSYTFGRLAEYTGRIALFSLAAVANLACILALFFWRPHPDQLPVFFVFPALWGMADAIWQTQTNALYGVLFPKDKEAAFANYRMWESLGFVIAFAYSTFICLSTKLCILLAVLVLNVLTYLWVEYNEYKHPTPAVVYATPPAEEKSYETKIISQTHL